MLVALVGLNVECDHLLIGRCPVGKHGHDAQASGIENEALLQRLISRNGDLAGEVCAAQRDVDLIDSGLQPQRRAGVADG